MYGSWLVGWRLNPIPRVNTPACQRARKGRGVQLNAPTTAGRGFIPQGGSPLLEDIPRLRRTGAGSESELTDCEQVTRVGYPASVTRNTGCFAATPANGPASASVSLACCRRGWTPFNRSAKLELYLSSCGEGCLATHARTNGATLYPPRMPPKRSPHSVAATAVDRTSVASDRSGHAPPMPWPIWRYHALARNAPPTAANGTVATCNAGAMASPTPALPRRPSPPGSTQHQGRGSRPVSGRSTLSNSRNRPMRRARSTVLTAGSRAAATSLP